LLSRLSIGLRAFLRDAKLFHAIDSIRRTMPEVQIIVADDGEMTEEKDSLYAEIIREGHKVLICPFDSGYGFKSNRIVDSLDREFLAPLADDFDFSPPSVKVGIEKMLAVLDQNPNIDIVSGRVNGHPYEFLLAENDGVVFEVPCNFDQYPSLAEPLGICDLTVNYSLIRGKVFDKVKWDDDQKIGEGEHGSFFLDTKKAGFRVAYVPGVEISEQAGQDSDRYRQYRSRARGSSRKCFEKRNLKKYVLGNGQVDYERKD
jgi:glycosyltransferase involved in cell wall biosynthesis